MVTFIQLDADVPSGNFGVWLTEVAIPFSHVRLFAGDSMPDTMLSGAIVVLGGSMGVNDTVSFPYLHQVKSFIRTCLAENIPYLGICLGGQLLAAELGAEVHSGRYGEKGLHRVHLCPAGLADPLFAGIPEEFLTFQWHNDSFALPSGARLLAMSATCPHQAFRYGDVAYGLQFHPEVDEQIVAAWSTAAGESGQRAALTGSFRGATSPYYAVSRQILLNFLHIASDFCVSRGQSPRTCGHPAADLEQQ